MTATGICQVKEWDAIWDELILLIEDGNIG
jgi:hypothetical protein